ncbi:hypothetical protein OROMI_004676 [Orobanche minor]
MIGSTSGAPEAAYAQTFGKGISLSEQQLVDCAGTFNNFECNGGLPSQAFEYIKYNGWLETEDAYPYTGKDGVCKYSSENVRVQVLDSVNITLGAEDELRHAVAFARPVGVAFEVVNGFRVYKGGVYTSNKCGSSPLATMSYSLSMDDDYEKLIKGMNPLRVVLDNESCKNVAVIQKLFRSLPMSILWLPNLICSDGGWFMDEVIALVSSLPAIPRSEMTARRAPLKMVAEGRGETSSSGTSD